MRVEEAEAHLRRYFKFVCVKFSKETKENKINAIPKPFLPRRQIWQTNIPRAYFVIERTEMTKVLPPFDWAV